jgi:hypothetical protein
MNSTHETSKQPATDPSMAQIMHELTEHLRGYQHVAGKADQALQTTDQLLRMYALQFAKNKAFEGLICRVVAAVENVDIQTITAEFTRTFEEEYERFLLKIGDTRPNAAEFLDVRPPEDRPSIEG